MTNREIAERAAYAILDSGEGIWESIPRRDEIASKFADIIESELESASGWKDIASAPKDGREVPTHWQEKPAPPSEEVEDKKLGQ